MGGWMTDKSLRLQIAVAAGAGALLATAWVVAASVWHGSADLPAALTGALLGGLAGVGVTIFLARRALRPIEQLRDSMAAVAGGRLEVAITPAANASHELRELTETFGRLVERMRDADHEHAQ